MVASATTTAAASPSGGKSGPVIPIPFTRGAKEHVEPISDNSYVLSANQVQAGPFDVPSYGFLRSLLFMVEATGGVASVTVTAFEDAPWNAIQEVALLDVNSAPIVGPLAGYDLYLIGKYGGYRYLSDPRQSSKFSAVAVGASASGNFAFILRLPIEVCNRDALGALANQNSASTYKLRYTVNSTTNIYGTAPNTTPPTMRVRTYLEAWSQPTGSDLRGRTQAVEPPAHGTLCMWSKYTLPVVNGFQQLRLPRVGNYLRVFLFVMRDNAGTPVRSAGAALFPDPAQIYWDTRVLHNYSRDVWKHVMVERYGFAAAAEAPGGLDNGVFSYDFMHEFDGHVGNELRDGYLPTTQSTRLEIAGTFTGAGNLTVITNDIAPAGEIFVN